MGRGAAGREPGLLESSSLLLQGPNAVWVHSRQSDVPGLRSVSVHREQVLLLP